YSGGTVDHKTLQIMGTKTGVSGDFLGRMGAMWGRLRTMRGINDPNPFGRMPFDIEEGSLIERIYSQLNVQWRSRVVQGVSGIADPRTTVAGPSRYFTVGRSSIPTMASMNRPT